MYDEMMDEMVEEMRDYDDDAFEQDLVEFYRGDYDPDDYYELGFDPYMGCYSDDC